MAANSEKGKDQQMAMKTLVELCNQVFYSSQASCQNKTHINSDEAKISTDEIGADTFVKEILSNIVDKCLHSFTKTSTSFEMERIENKPEDTSNRIEKFICCTVEEAKKEDMDQCMLHLSQTIQGMSLLQQEIVVPDKSIELKSDLDTNGIESNGLQSALQFSDNLLQEVDFGIASNTSQKEGSLNENITFVLEQENLKEVHTSGETCTVQAECKVKEAKDQDLPSEGMEVTQFLCEQTSDKESNEMVDKDFTDDSVLKSQKFGELVEEVLFPDNETFEKKNNHAIVEDLCLFDSQKDSGSQFVLITHREFKENGDIVPTKSNQDEMTDSVQQESETEDTSFWQGQTAEKQLSSQDPVAERHRVLQDQISENEFGKQLITLEDFVFPSVDRIHINNIAQEKKAEKADLEDYERKIVEQIAVHEVRSIQEDTKYKQCTIHQSLPVTDQGKYEIMLKNQADMEQASLQNQNVEAGEIELTEQQDSKDKEQSNTPNQEMDETYFVKSVHHTQQSTERQHVQQVVECHALNLEASQQDHGQSADDESKEKMVQKESYKYETECTLNVTNISTHQENKVETTDVKHSQELGLCCATTGALGDSKFNVIEVMNSREHQQQKISFGDFNMENNITKSVLPFPETNVSQHNRKRSFIKADENLDENEQSVKRTCNDAEISSSLTDQAVPIELAADYPLNIEDTSMYCFGENSKQFKSSEKTDAESTKVDLYCGKSAVGPENEVITFPVKQIDKAEGGVFKWKYVPSFETDAVVPQTNGHDGFVQLVTVAPLPVCRKPRRLGLSKKQKIQHLHINFQHP